MIPFVPGNWQTKDRILVIILLAALASNPFDRSYEELGFVDLGKPAECVARTDKGSIRLDHAIEPGTLTMTPVALITGQTTTRLAIGQRVYISTYYAPTWRALVVRSTDKEATVSVSLAIAGQIIADDTSSATLSRDEAGKAIIPFTFIYNIDGLRPKLAAALDCFHEHKD